MSNKLRYCLICKRSSRLKHVSYTRIYNIEREEKLREGYRQRYNGEELNQPLLNQIVHKKCYNKIIQYIPSNDNSTSIEQQQNDDDEEQDQIPIVQSRSCISVPQKLKHHLERSQRLCIVCNTYKYSTADPMKQIVSNYIAKKLAEGYLHRYKQPYGKSLLDAYIHRTCYRKLYSSYRYQPSRKILNRNRLLYLKQFHNQSLDSTHETRSRSNHNRLPSNSNEIEDLSIEELFSKPFSTTNPNIEQSARSCLFRPCMQRVTSEEIEFYTKRNSVQNSNTEENSFIPASIADDSIIELNEDNHDHIDTDEQESSVLHTATTILNKQLKICAPAEIRYRYSKPPPNPLLNDHIYTPTIYSEKPCDNLETLYQWLIEQLKSNGNPISMNEVLTKYRTLTDETIDLTKRQTFCRIQLRNRLEKLYPNKFVFVVPNRRDGTYIALNDIDTYVRMAIKKVQQEKEKAIEASIVSSVIIPTKTTEDYKRETCETVMNSIRKIRLYMRDPKQINSSPSLFMQNLIGLITASERQFQKLSNQYDFYRMIDENLFENINQTKSNKQDKTIRNMSLASDLLSARHDNHISQKHYLLADEISKETFRCTPPQIITLLNRYGHTCSHRSYRRLKALGQQMIDELGENLMTDEDKSSTDSELDLMKL